jgi:hypothetical protein
MRASRCIGKRLDGLRRENHVASDAYHESSDLLTEETRNMHRAIVSLKEELEAIDWYQQRADACSNPRLKDVLLHNKNEEIEHATMLMEWIRRHNDHFDEMMRQYLFTEQPITDIERGAETGGPAPAADETLGVGSMKGQ